ncbi:MAG: Hsp20/alpha crystallin family protein [Candidatus Thorarchaeota archaeon]|jgi:HSP20 family protein
MYYKKFNDNIRDWFNDDFFYSTFSVDPTEIKQRVTDTIKNKMDNKKYSYNLPVTNIYEDDWSFRYELLTPGFTKKDINVSIENGSLSVEGERKDGKIERVMKEGSYISKEYHSTNFNRVFTLPDNVVCEEIHAKVKNGITTIFFPKEKKSNPKTHNRKITVD